LSFDGVPASFNAALFAPNSAVVQIPSIQFSKIDTTKLYTVHYRTTGGSTTFSFKLGPAAPTIGQYPMYLPTRVIRFMFLVQICFSFKAFRIGVLQSSRLN
jgi:hypothetical protein